MEWKETIAQEAKRLLEPIPEERWGVDNYYADGGKCCMLGHLNRIKTGNASNTEGSRSLSMAAMHFLNATARGYLAYQVNDGECPNYPQSTPKQRSLALIDDMIKAGL